MNVRCANVRPTILFSRLGSGGEPFLYDEYIYIKLACGAVTSKYNAINIELGTGFLFKDTDEVVPLTGEFVYEVS